LKAPFVVVPLAGGYDRLSFSCGAEALDRYFHTQVTQDVRRRVTTCYVAIGEATECLAGYYTLAAASMPLTGLPDNLIRRLPRYPAVPVARLGRLAVDTRFRGRKLSAALLWDATARALRSEVAVFALLVDAKDETAERFYAHHGFVELKHATRQWVLPLTSDMVRNLSKQT
jgi:GNAT superfamily N-acetyltransferase